MGENLLVAVVGSAVGGFACAMALKLSLAAWKNIVLSIGWVFGFGAILGLVIFGSQTIVEQIAKDREIQSLEDKIEKYVRGNYPEAYEDGFSIQVVDISSRVFLGLYSPNERTINGEPNPLANVFVRQEIASIVNNEGYPGEPVFGDTVKPLTDEDMKKLFPE